MEASTAILKWINTFNISSECTSISELSDGIIIHKMLCEIGPEYFESTTLVSPEIDTDNWLLRAGNIRQLLNMINDYYTNDLNRHADIANVDANAIARDRDEEEIIGILELVIGAAVTCQNRAQFIQAIFGLDEDSKLVLKGLVESSMQRSTRGNNNDDDDNDNNDNTTNDDDNDNDKNNSEELIEAHNMIKRLQEERQRLLASTNDLETSNQDLSEQVQTLSKQIESLNDEKEKHEHIDRGRLASMESNNAQLQMDLDETKRELDFKISENEDLYSEKEKLLKEVNNNKEIVVKLETENRMMSDNLDIAKDKASQLVKMESQLEKYQKKVEELSVLKKTNKELESRMDGYLDQIHELENNNKSIGTANKMLEEYKDAKVELESKNFELRSTIEVKEHELTRKQQALDSSLDEKRRIEEELNEARKDWEEKMKVMEAEVLKAEARVDDAEDEDGETRSSLKLKLKESILEVTQLRDAARKSNSENETQSAQTLMLTSELENVRKALNAREQSLSESMKEVSELKTLSETLKNDIEMEKQKATSAAEAFESKEGGAKLELQQQLETKDRMVEMLQEKLKEKEGIVNKLTQDKSKLETFAKNSLSNFKDKYLNELNRFRAEKKEWKDKYNAIAKIKERNEETYRREERLLLSSMYEIGVRILDRNLQSSMRVDPSSPTFLQARRAEQDRRTSVGVSVSNTGTPIVDQK